MSSFKAEGDDATEDRNQQRRRWPTVRFVLRLFLANLFLLIEFSESVLLVCVFFSFQHVRDV